MFTETTTTTFILMTTKEKTVNIITNIEAPDFREPRKQSV